MADSKITALTSIGASTDPANDPLVLVDVSDTSMAASGTTKKVTVNQILGAGGTATLASATITGDLTVDTSTLKVDSANNRVGIGTASPSQTFQVLRGGNGITAGFSGGTYGIRFDNGGTFSPNGSTIFGVDTTLTGTYHPLGLDGSVLTFGISGSEQMRLNSTGLGVGVSPSYKLDVSSSSNIVGRVSSSSVLNTGFNIVNTTGSTWSLYSFGSNDATLQNSFGIYHQNGTSFLQITQAGNVGVGVTPSAWATYKAVSVGGIGASVFGLGSSQAGVAQGAFFNNGSGSGWAYSATSQVPAYYLQINGEHRFHNAVSGTAGNQITAWTQAMTLDASGNLLVGTTSASSLIGGSGAITAKGIAGILSVNVTALSTNFTLPIGAFSGILVIRSNGGGGSAVWMLDPNAGAVSISNNIVGRTITFTFSGGAWQLQQTVGTVPSTYNYNVIATQ